MSYATTYDQRPIAKKRTKSSFFGINLGGSETADLSAYSKLIAAVRTSVGSDSVEVTRVFEEGNPVNSELVGQQFNIKDLLAEFTPKDDKLFDGVNIYEGRDGTGQVYYGISPTIEGKVRNKMSGIEVRIIRHSQ